MSPELRNVNSLNALLSSGGDVNNVILPEPTNVIEIYAYSIVSIACEFYAPFVRFPKRGDGRCRPLP
ncbi:MAG: hypothetical protein AB4426_14185 [Xenococcaceae cyanobacterium]